ncbi:asparagine synthase (glutamine-hydrolyzing) [Thalassospira australica]|uniref:asparagine synthase (glutamine-hydrolyzing) n=1 Tax=Thalassospira australica TaxID=1528106 RepID=UPI000519F3E4|nr:asparagine synthase (glutamine-hydrolyzing) [Thalassospira australica]
MCGFAGLYQAHKSMDRNQLAGQLQAAGNAILHRGPDDEGFWIDAHGHIGLAFRRLAIQDLSNAGHQPMESYCGRFVIAFNGEIYNHLELRRSLEIENPDCKAWRGHSDTETLIMAIHQWGLDETLAQLDGMYSFALWDNKTQKLTLARDPFGEKPLYYATFGNSVAFSSEIKALPPLGVPNDNIDDRALASYLRHRYIPAPKTIWQHIRKLRAGEYIQWSAETGSNPRHHQYWNGEKEAVSAYSAPFEGTREDAKVLLGEKLENLAARRLIADTPLGCFLSGGIDSSLVTALAAKASEQPVGSYTIRFDNPRYNEADHAQKVAAHLGTNHHEVHGSAQEAAKLVPELAKIWDEPFADPSQVPTLLLCRKTRQHVTVALSGDGGDEFFLGYSRYAAVKAGWHSRNPKRLPSRFFPWKKLDKLAGLLRNKPSVKARRSYTKMLRDATNKLPAFNHHHNSFWRHGLPLNREYLQDGMEIDDIWPLSPETVGILPTANSLMVADSLCYLPEDLMVKVDRASMSTSLETRTPFLNRELAKLCWSMPQSWNEGEDGRLKTLLRDILYDHVPAELVDRPKQGFDPPIREWLRCDLRQWANEQVEEMPTALKDRLDMTEIGQCFEDHQRGANLEGDLWPILMLSAWGQENLSMFEQ